MRKGYVSDILLGAVGIVLLLLSVPYFRHDVALGAIGIVGGALITIGAAIDIIRRRPSSSDR